MLEQMDVTESSWPGPGFMEPMFPSAPTPAPTPSSFPMEESRPSSKPKAKKKAKKKKKAAKKSRPKAKKKSAKKKNVRRASCVVLLSIAVACSAPKIPLGNPPQEIAAMLQRSAADWNRGDLAGFMSDYANDSLT